MYVYKCICMYINICITLCSAIFQDIPESLECMQMTFQKEVEFTVEHMKYSMLNNTVANY